MNTKSKTNLINLKMENEKKKQIDNPRVLYKVEINFDESIEAWRTNKKCIGNGHYKYICCQKTKAGNPCKRESLQFCDYCKIHTPKHVDLL